MSRRLSSSCGPLALALALASACTDKIATAPEITAARPLLDVSAAAAAPVSFCNPATITISAAAPAGASPYPSQVTVSGIPSGPFRVTATLKGLSHTLTADVDMLLVGPGGQYMMLMSDAGGSADFQNATVTFDDNATAQLTATTPGVVLPSGTYKPVNFGTGDFFGQGLVEPFLASFAVFAGTEAIGTWRLYVWDDQFFHGGSIANGWCVNILSTNSAPAANAGGPYSGAEGSPITFDGTNSSDPDNNIASYAWDFGDGETGSGLAPEHTYANSGTYTVTLLVTDDDGVTSQATASVTVDNVAPTAAFSAPASVNEGSAIALALTDAADPSPSDQEAGFTYAFDCGGGYGEFGAASSASCATIDDETRQFRAKIRDTDLGESEYTAAVNVTNVAPVVTSLTLPTGPIAVNTPITLSAAFTDVGTADTHVGAFELGPGGPVAAGMVAEADGSGSVTATVSFAQAGVYTITVGVTDDDGMIGSRSSASEMPASVLVYDPSGGSVAGLGAFDSPTGALTGNPSFAGRATFGLGAKYLDGGATLAAHLELVIKTANFHFRSTRDDLLIIAGGKAHYRGEGTVNGVGSYGFQVTALDGGFIGVGWERLTANDKIRVRISDKGTGAVVYDNQPGAPEMSDPTSPLSAGGIVILNR
jgi:PKD repeat protein